MQAKDCPPLFIRPGGGERESAGVRLGRRGPVAEVKLSEPVTITVTP